MEVNFCQPSLPNLAEYRLVFGNTLHFGAAASALALDARLLGLPVIRDAAALRLFLRQAPANFLVKYRSQAGDVARIRGLLSERPSPRAELRSAGRRPAHHPVHPAPPPGARGAHPSR
jgi:hypothetical protein